VEITSIQEPSSVSSKVTEPLHLGSWISCGILHSGLGIVTCCYACLVVGYISGTCLPDIFGDDACLQFGGGTLGHPAGIVSGNSIWAQSGSRVESSVQKAIMFAGVCQHVQGKAPVGLRRSQAIHDRGNISFRQDPAL
jgi:hypothetical protein